ncbi:MAG: response regulator [Bacteroidales bacterium]|nr:response regulator [Bacteroidales bacterium]
MIKKWRSYLFHPLILGIILSVVAIFIFAAYLPKYYTEIIEESMLFNNGEIYFYDLDNDGNSEKINYCHYDKIFQPTLYLYDSEDNFKALWNFFESPVKNSRIYSGDYNNDSIKEIFVFTEKDDSVFLYILNPENDAENVIQREYITSITGNKDIYKILSIGLFESKQKNEKDFFFSIDAGYPDNPVKLYSFNISGKSLKSSPNINAKIKAPVIVDDINNDGIAEVLISNESVNVPGNGSTAQLIVLDNNLNYLFNPVGFQGTRSELTTDIVKINNKNFIAVLNSGTTTENTFNNLMLYDISGKRIQEKIISGKSNLEIIDNLTYHDNLFLFSGKKIIRYNSDFKKIKSFLISRKAKVQFIGSVDISSDGRPELIFKNNNELILVNENLRFSSKLNISGEGTLNISISESTERHNQLSVQLGDKWYLIDYYRNDAFFYNQILYISIFVIITFLTFIVFSIVNRRTLISGKIKDKKYKEIEENIEDKLFGLKSRLSEIKNEFKEYSYNKVIDEIEDTFEEVKTITKEIRGSADHKVDFNKSLSALSKRNEDRVNLSYSLFPEQDWGKTAPVIEFSIIEFCDGLFSKLDKSTGRINISIQLINHSEYINVLIEAEDFYIENKSLRDNKDLINILKGVNGKYDLDTFSGFGTVFNVAIPLKFNKTTENNKVQGKIRVILAEDHEVSLFGLISLFKTKNDIEIIGTAKNGMEVLKILETKKTDIVITDISMPGMDGIELSEKLQSDFPDVKVIVFTMYMENWFVEQLLNFGAKGFVSKTSKIIELHGAVKNVYAGNNYYCPQFKSKFGFKNKSNGNGNGNRLDSLTKAELLIIKFYAENLTKNQIAEKMDLSMEITESFIANILLKLNAGDEEEIIRIARKQKFI